MGYWAGRDSQRFFIENGVVLSGPKGVPLPIDPVTFEILKETPAAPTPAPEEPVIEEKNVLKDYTDEKKVDEFVKEGKNVKPVEHLKDCETKGRWGRYTEGCPRCEFIKKAK